MDNTDFNTRLTVTYEGCIGTDEFHHETTVTKMLNDPTMGEIFLALREIFMALGYAPETVREYFDDKL